MRKITLAIFALMVGCGPSPKNHDFSAVSSASSSESRPDYWVKSQYLDRHSCPSLKCGIVGRNFYREKVTIYEYKGKWVRISQFYDAFCQNGISQIVDKGWSACVQNNGIVNDQLAEWVLLTSLSKLEPIDPSMTAQADEKLVSQSDDFLQYHVAFAKAAKQLIKDGICTSGDFEENGGWVKSSSRRDLPVYFMYCGGSSISNRIYLNAKNGSIYR